MATTMPWLPGWPAVLPRRRAARAHAIPAPSGPPLARGERVLLTTDGVVATDRACYHAAPPDSGAEWARLGWEQIVRADPYEHGLVLTAWAPGLPPRTVLTVHRAGRLLALARERVAATTLITTRVFVDGEPARVTARRRPGTGEILWLVAGASPTPATLARLRATYFGG